MKPAIIILSVLILLGVAGAYYLSGIARGAKIIIIMNRLTEASADLKKKGAFTNDISSFCDIHAYAEHHSFGAKEYQCVLAATSPAFRDRGFMAITTNDVLLWIDKERGATPLSGTEVPPGL
jgi:hypothetical protein